MVYVYLKSVIEIIPYHYRNLVMWIQHMKMILVNWRHNTNSHRHTQRLHFLRTLKKGVWYVS